MCQTNNKLVKLKKDRIAYKVEEFINGNWVTPFRQQKLKRNTIITARGGKSSGYEINAGYFHCFTNKKRIASFIKKPDERVVKVIIPKNENIVYSGKFRNFILLGEIVRTINSICARKIILTDEVVWESK